MEPGSDKLEEVNEDNCFNTTTFGFAEMYTITTTEPEIRNAEAKEGESAAQTLTALQNAWVPALLTLGAWLMM